VRPDILESIYSDIDSGGAYDVLAGGFGELEYPKRGARDPMQKLQDTGSSLGILAVLAVGALYLFAPKKRV
jgi:hypothetical protein